MTDAEKILLHFGLYVSYYLTKEDKLAEFNRGCIWYLIGFGG